ncbi:MAG: hypothetical protein Q8N14_01325 [Candidatus Omnitrophota bacterium]|nr:hypothetical protein [Candidatus Omnitrophota bacterium]
MKKKNNSQAPLEILSYPKNSKFLTGPPAFRRAGQAVAEYLLLFSIVAAVSLLGIAVFYDTTHRTAEQFFNITGAAIVGKTAGSAVDFDEPPLGILDCSAVQSGAVLFLDSTSDTFFCKFSGSSCPSGWKPLRNWTETQSAFADCCDSCDDWCWADNMECWTGSHSFEDKQYECCSVNRKTCENAGRDCGEIKHHYCVDCCDDWGACYGVYRCVPATITYIGCVPN